VLLKDGGIARRIRSYNICGTEYYTVTIDGNPKRIKSDVLAAYLSQPRNYPHD
jgi:hypothetical protein